MKTRWFDSYEELAGDLVDFLAEAIEETTFGRRAIMLSGGETPLPAYRMLAERDVVTPDNVYVLLSDERFVPVTAPDSNYGNIAPMLHTLGFPDHRILRVHTDVPIEEAAQHYDGQLHDFLKTGGRVPIGLLGLGADGHTASLFTEEDLRSPEDRYAIAVTRPEKPDRVSVTPAFLSHVSSLIFLVSGPEKRPLLDRLLHDPGSTVAGQAVAAAKNVEVWIS